MFAVDYAALAFALLSWLLPVLLLAVPVAGYDYIAAGPHRHAFGGHGHYSQPGVSSVQTNHNNQAYLIWRKFVIGEFFGRRFRLCFSQFYNF